MGNLQTPLIKVITIVISLATLCFGLHNYTYQDNVPPSQDPPGGLKPSQVPQFVTIGFDDNMYSGTLKTTDAGGGITFVTDELCAGRVNPAGNVNTGTYDGEPISITFFPSSIYCGDQQQNESPLLIKLALNKAYEDGHEIGNHTHSHGNGAISTVQGWNLSSWENEISTCTRWLIKPKPDTTSMPYWEVNSPDEWKKQGAEILNEDVIGFRTPFLAYSDYTFQALKNNGIVYDCSIEEGSQSNQDGTNYFWPYTLDNGSPAAPDIGNHPGLWEMGCHLVVKPDGSKMTGLDYNMWIDAKMTKSEFVNTLIHTLDLRLQGNRCPFLFGAHSDEYSSKWIGQCNASVQERRQALVEFFEYALSKPDVRIVRYDKVLAWMRDPVPLGPTPIYNHNSLKNKRITISVQNGSIIVKTKEVLEKSEMNFVLFDMYGRVVARKEMRQFNNQMIKWNIVTIASGNYLLKIDGDIRFQKRITFMR